MLAFPRVLGTVPLDELSLSGILQLWNRRFQVSGMQSRGNSCWHLVIARRDNAVAIQASGTSLRGAIASWQSCLQKKDCFTPVGFAMTKNPQRGCGKPEKHSKIVSESLGKWKNAKHNGEVIFAAIPSLRAKPHESWELVPLDELSLSGILQRWNQRFQVSGMRRRSNPCWHLVIARRDSTVAILSAEKDCFYTSSITPLSQ